MDDAHHPPGPTPPGRGAGRRGAAPVLDYANPSARARSAIQIVTDFRHVQIHEEDQPVIIEWSWTTSQANWMRLGIALGGVMAMAGLWRLLSPDPLELDPGRTGDGLLILFGLAVSLLLTWNLRPRTVLRVRRRGLTLAFHTLFGVQRKHWARQRVTGLLVLNSQLDFGIGGRPTAQLLIRVGKTSISMLQRQPQLLVMHAARLVVRGLRLELPLDNAGEPYIPESSQIPAEDPGR